MREVLIAGEVSRFRVKVLRGFPLNMKRERWTLKPGPDTRNVEPEASHVKHETYNLRPPFFPTSQGFFARADRVSGKTIAVG